MRYADLARDPRRRRRYPPQATIWTFVAPVALIVCVVIVVSVLRGGVLGSAKSPAATVTSPAPGLSGVASKTSRRHRRFVRVHTGQTLTDIARIAHTTIKRLLALNPHLTVATTLQVGQRVRIS